MKKIVWLGLSIVLVMTMMLASCGGDEETATEETVAEETVTEATQPDIPTDNPATPPGSGNWWDIYGEPEYGGTLTLKSTSDVQSFDSYRGADATNMTTYVYEVMGLASVWTLDRDEFSYQTMWTPDRYWALGICESWDMSDPYKHVFHIRKGIMFQDKEPVNGREMTADDIGWSFCRIIGCGYGFTEPTPYRGTGTYYFFDNIYSTDKYTLVFEFTKPVFDIQDTIANGYSHIHPKEVIEQYGERAFEDWKNQVGTGPFILKDYVTGTGGTLIKNNNYWDYDERFPENRLPYLDELKVLVIPDSSTAMAALRTGKIDIMNRIEWEQAQRLMNTNPELTYRTGESTANGLRPRVDVEPFDDVKVRMAMNMAIDRETIAKTFFGGHVSGDPIGIVSCVFPDWCTPYTEWPKEVQEVYEYNPERAKELLAEAGYPEGFQTNIVIGSTHNLDLCQIFQAYLRDIGIEMEINVVENTVFSDYVNTSRKHDQIAWEASCAGWTSSPMRGFTLFDSKNRRNNQNINDPVYDAIYIKEIAKEGESITAAESEARTIAKVKELDMYVMSQFWTVPGVPNFTFTFWQPWLKGYTAESGRCALSYSRVWIDQKLKKDMLGN